jgi:uncharacterized protein
LSNYLLIFIKNPILGQVKTRLAATIGTAEALRVYTQLLAATRRAAALLADVRCVVYYSDEIAENDAWHNDIFAKRQQLQSPDLGERMAAAFAEAFAAGAEKVVIIGSDCPDLTTAGIEAAFDALDACDMVLGPAADGGYYLLGLRTMQPNLWRDMTWSVATVCAETLRRAAQKNLSVQRLPTLTDIDTYADYLAVFGNRNKPIL